MKHRFILLLLVLLNCGNIFAQSLDTSALKIKLTGHSGDLECVAFSPNGKWLASSGWDNKINIYQIDTPGFGTLLKTLSGHLATVTSLSFSKDNRFIVSAGKDYSIRIWNIDTPANVKVFSTLHNEAVTCAIVDGKYLFSSSVEGTVRYTLISDIKKTKILKPGAAVNDIVVGNDKKTVYIALNNSVIKKYDIISGKETGTLQGHIDYVNSLDLSPDGKTLVSASNDKMVIVWDLLNAKPLKKLNGHEWKVTSVKFSSDGKYIVSGGNDGSIKLWEVESGKNINSFKNVGGHNVREVAFSPNATKIAVASYMKGMQGNTYGALVYNSGVESTKPMPKTAPNANKGTIKGKPAGKGVTAPATESASKGKSTTKAIAE